MRIVRATITPSSSRRLALLLCAAWLGAPVHAAEPAPGIDVVPASADFVVGQPVQLVLHDLPAGAEVTVQASRAVREWSGTRRVYASEAVFRAGPDGRVDLATQAPLRGSYQGADLRGLMWSMQPQREGGGEVAAFGDNEVRLQVRPAAAAPGAAPLAVKTLQVRDALPGLQWRDAAPFPGARMAWLPAAGAAPAKRPAIIALGGSEGGSAGVLGSAALLASHGYVVLGLPYYSPSGWGATGPTPPELPALPAAFADIPVDRLAQARDWLAQQPEVDASRIALYGVSKGAEFVLLAASKMPWVRSVVAVVPSDVVWEGWGPGVDAGQRASFSWQGKPLDFVPYVDFDAEFAGFRTGQPVRVRRPQDKGRAAHPERVPAARIRIEDFAGPVLLVGGGDDQMWDSAGMAQNIARSRRARGLETVALVYPEAGHGLSGTGWAPTTQYNAGPMKMGGTPAADGRAQGEAFLQTLRFLERSLR